MNISSMMQANIASIQQAVQMVSLRSAMNQDGAVVNKLIKGMQETSDAVQKAGFPHKGNYIDIKV